MIIIILLIKLIENILNYKKIKILKKLNFFNINTKKSIKNARRGIYALKHIKSGEVLTKEILLL